MSEFEIMEHLVLITDARYSGDTATCDALHRQLAERIREANAYAKLDVVCDRLDMLAARPKHPNEAPS